MLMVFGFHAVATEAAPQQPPLIPRSVFFGNADRAAPQISPDGERLAYLAPHNNVMNIWVQMVGGEDARPLTRSPQRPIRNYRWAANGKQVLYSLDRDGDENFHIYAVDVESGEEVDLTPFDGVQARIVATDRDRPDEVLVAVNNRIPHAHDALLVNTRTGEGRLVFQNDDGYAEFLADSSLAVRIVTKVQPDGGSISWVRDSDVSPWRELAAWSLLDSQSSGPLAFSRDGQMIYLVDSRGADTGRLFVLDQSDPAEPAYTMVASSERADLGEVVFSPKTGRPQAAAFDYEREEWIVLDSSVAGDWEYLDGVTVGEFRILSRDRADRIWTVSDMVDDGPIRYYLYDRVARRAEYLFPNRSQLENVPLAKMQPVVIRSRDGLNLVSYLTLPREEDQAFEAALASRPLPMVLLVHGGPWARDSWGFNAVHQWLANRGYAVLSVNFRGSTGFGKEFLNAGNRQWARKMHDDLIDAVNWAVERNIADPDKVAIMGGSYGGYATLVGLTFTPEFFAAGVDIVGPSHLRTLLETIPPYWAPVKAMFEQRMGSLSEGEFLDSISPLTKVDAIVRPLLIGQGANDPRVKQAESEQIVGAMQAKNLPVTYIVFPDEGHGFHRPENNLAFFAVTEQFLAQHIGGRSEPIASEIRSSSARIEAGGELIPGLRESSDR